MWRAYARTAWACVILRYRDAWGEKAKVPELRPPSTKGFWRIPGVPEADDVNITRNNIEDNFAAFNFTQASDIAHYSF